MGVVVVEVFEFASEAECDVARGLIAELENKSETQSGGKAEAEAGTRSFAESDLVHSVLKDKLLLEGPVGYGSVGNGLESRMVCLSGDLFEAVYRIDQPYIHGD